VPGAVETPGDRLIALQNPGFESDPVAGVNCAPLWGCSAHSDPQSFRYVVDDAVVAGGRRSLRMERVKPEPWALATQVIRDPKLRGAKLRFSLAVRTENATGNGAGVFFLAHGPGGSMVGHQQRLAKGTTDWQRLAVDVVVPAGAELFEVGAIVEGPGRAWFDDARLEVVELASAVK
jgi:hypothetical protein